MSQIEYSKMSLLHYRIERGLVLTLQFSRGKYKFHTSLREIWTTQQIWATQSYFFPTLSIVIKYYIVSLSMLNFSTLKDISTYYLLPSSSILLNVLLLNSSKQSTTKFKNVCACQYRTLCPRVALLVGTPWFYAKAPWKWQEQTPKISSLHCLWMVWAYIFIDILTTSP